MSVCLWNQCQTVDRFRRQWNFHHENDENENAKPIRFTSSTTDAPIPMTLSLTIALFVDCADRNYILHAWIYGIGDKWWMHSDIHALNKSRTSTTHTHTIDTVGTSSYWIYSDLFPMNKQWNRRSISLGLEPFSVVVLRSCMWWSESGDWILVNECGRYRQWIATCLCLCVQWTIVIFFQTVCSWSILDNVCVCECVPQNLEDCTCTVHGVIDDDWDLDFMWVGNSCSNYVIRNSLYFMVYANLDNGK